VSAASIALVAAALLCWRPAASPTARVSATATHAAVRSAPAAGRGRARRRREASLDPRSLALTADLIAAGLRAGLPVAAAILTVAECAGTTPESSIRAAVEPLRRVGRLIQWGADPAEAWRLAEERPGLETIGAAGRRCAHSGARLAAALETAAIQLRAQRRDQALARAERVGVWALLPLGLCFLPAFVCLGVLPVIVGLGGHLLAGQL
jgi:pilus assembly protein TadC